VHAKKPVRGRLRHKAWRWPAQCVSVRCMVQALIYHMCRVEEWRAAQETGIYAGSDQDRADGFIHFSTAAQVMASAAKHRAGQHDLMLLAVDPAALGVALRWEPARGGDLFPH